MARYLMVLVINSVLLDMKIFISLPDSVDIFNPLPHTFVIHIKVDDFYDLA